MTRDYLNKTTLGFSPLVEEKPIRVSNKCAARSRKVFPIIGIMGIMIGSAFLGFSFINVPAGSVGYSVCDDTSCKYMSTGIYFTLPWNKNTVKIETVSPQNLTIGRLHGNNNGSLYTTGSCTVEYNVENVSLYLRSLESYKTKHMMDIALIGYIKQFVTNVIDTQDHHLPTFNISVSIHGTRFTRFYFD